MKYYADFKQYPARLVPKTLGIPLTFGKGTEIRNQCWNCENYFDLNLPVLPHEVNQKKYFTCNYCHKVNHI